MAPFVAGISASVAAGSVSRSATLLPRRSVSHVGWAVRENDGEFKNAVCSVRYDNKDEMENPPLFGAKFHFTLDSQIYVKA
ncbi:hypothetical protein ANCDUO_21038 [Ancylostoma duodenale]|uniref:Uncharacterized protein n=1 Tax=Ancylostoma duodenale TaxID=51022 RepID=A0A0C2CGK0_9BILA|nr:hypothetical protein ANCDUO_21038 [Ancylostoma duodenale]